MNQRMKQHERIGRISSVFQHYQDMSLSKLRDEQLAKLKRLVSHHYEHNEVYRKMLDERGVLPSHITSLEDIALLPIITKDDIMNNGKSFWTQSELNRTFLHTSGSTGKSKILPVHFGEESKRIAENVGLGFYITGFRTPDIVYCTFPCGPWPSSFFSHNGGELLGPVDKADMSLPIDWHIANIKSLSPKYVLASPSFITYFAGEVSKRMNPADLGFSVITLAGEPFGEKCRSRLEEMFKAPIMDLYGCAEISAASMECPHLKGSGFHHILSHEMIMEARSVETGKMLPIGSQGEMIVTPLFRSSIPLIRYAMGDLITLSDESASCDCGLSFPLVSRVEGRVDDMLKYGGACLYPNMFYSALENMGFMDKFRVIVKRIASGKDSMLIQVEDDYFAKACPEQVESMRGNLEENLRRLSAELNNSLRAGFIEPIRLEFHEKGGLYQKTGKFKRFIYQD